MSWSDRFTALVRRHVPERRLAELATATAEATAAEERHLDRCGRCRRLLAGHARADAVLSGAWADTALARGPAIARDRGLAPVVPLRGQRTPARAVPALAAKIVIAVLLAGGLLAARSQVASVPSPSTAAGSPAASGAATRTPAGNPTRVVARLEGGTAEWSPDGAHLLAGDVFDRAGVVKSRVRGAVDWLDAGHLLFGDAHVAAIGEDYAGPESNTGVVANGHGTAAVIVAVLGCTGDPEIKWYRDGRFGGAAESASPFGWSPDGRLALLGHFRCEGMDAELHGWKGPVQVVEFPSRRVLATAPAVRGALAFNPSATRLAAESDAALNVVTIAGGAVVTVPDARLLGWLDDDSLYVYRPGTGQVELVHVASARQAEQVVASGEWAIPSPAGPRLVLNARGEALRIDAADGRLLLDLAPYALGVRDRTKPEEMRYSGLVARPWSPDGTMLALPSRDLTAVGLFAVNPKVPGAVESALPTSVPEPAALAESPVEEGAGSLVRLAADPTRDWLWFVSLETAGKARLERHPMGAGETSGWELPAGSAGHLTLAVGPDGSAWAGIGRTIVRVDSASGRATTVELPPTAPDIEAHPVTGSPDPWISAIAFDEAGNALVARHRVHSLLRLDSHLGELGRIALPDGMAYDGDLALAGGRLFVGADRAEGLVFILDPGDARGGSKTSASSFASAGGHVLAAGSPPRWIEPDGGPVSLVAPAPASAELVAGLPDGRTALYSRSDGLVQWRDATGHVTGQGLLAAASQRQLLALALTADGAAWVAERGPKGWRLLRLEPVTRRG